MFRILPAKEILDIQSAAGGMHDYRSLEGTFLGGCLFSGRNAGRAAGYQGFGMQPSDGVPTASP
jgi:hypothetical protein